MAIAIRVAGERLYIPRDGKGKYSSPSDRNEHPAHRGGEYGDVQGEMLGLLPFMGEALREHQRAVFPMLTTVNTGNGKGTNKGRGPSVEDAPWLSLKMVAADKTGGTGGAEVLTSPSERTTRAFLASPRAGEVAALAILAQRDADGVYQVDPGHVLYDVRYPYVELAAGGLDAAFARAGGRGRPRKDAVLPDTWATWIKSTCADGRSSQLSYRHPRTDDVSGWTVGTLAEVRAIALQLATRK
jgi:hypothetical protein